MRILENEFLDELRKVIDRHPRGYQTHLANELGIRTASFSNMLNGRRGIDDQLRAKIAMLAGIDLGTLMQRAGIIPPDHTALAPKPLEHTAFVLDPQEAAFIRAYRETGKDKATIGKFTEQLRRAPYLKKNAGE